MENKNTNPTDEDKDLLLRAESYATLIQNFQSTTPNADLPISCTGVLPIFDSMRRGLLASEIIISKEYYFDPRNQEGSLEQRREKLKGVIKKIFKDFINLRTKEYKAVSCHYRGIDWNKPGGSSWKTIVCQPGFAFIPSSLVRTTNGDWKEGPVWGKDYSSLSWKTGGHRRSETFAEVDATYFQIDEKVIEELNSVRDLLHSQGIPTELP